MTEKRVEDLQRGEWQPGNTYPSTPGVYERDYTNAGYSGKAKTQWSRWDGKNWRIGSLYMEKAEHEWGVSLEQKIPWRGQIEVKP